MDLVAKLMALSNYDDGPSDLTGIITPPECAACGAEVPHVHGVTRFCDDCHAESEDVPRCPLCGDPTCGGWCG